MHKYEVKFADGLKATFPSELTLAELTRTLAEGVAAVFETDRGEKLVVPSGNTTPFLISEVPEGRSTRIVL